MAAPGHMQKEEGYIESWEQEKERANQPSESSQDPELAECKKTLDNELSRISKNFDLPNCEWAHSVIFEDFGYNGEVTINGLWPGQPEYSPLIVEGRFQDHQHLCGILIQEVEMEVKALKNAYNAFMKCQQVWQEYDGNRLSNYSWTLDKGSKVQVWAEYTDREGRPCRSMIKDGRHNPDRRKALQLFCGRVDDDAKFAEKQKVQAKEKPDSTEKGEASTQSQA